PGGPDRPGEPRDDPQLRVPPVPRAAQVLLTAVRHRPAQRTAQGAPRGGMLRLTTARRPPPLEGSAMKIFRSDYDPVTPVDLPIHDAVPGHAAEFGDIPALIDGVEGTTITYTQLDGFTRRIAAALAETGVRKGDVLALHSPNTIAYPAVFYGATRA